jgi:hypothetical protein
VITAAVDCCPDRHVMPSRSRARTSRTDRVAGAAAWAREAVFSASLRGGESPEEPRGLRGVVTPS